MSEKSSGGIEFPPKMRDVPDIAPNPSNLPIEEQEKIPEQKGRFIIAMVPKKKKPLPESPTEKSLSS